MTNRIAQGIITGYFTILDVPSQLVAGKDIIITVGYYAYNPDPNVSFWDPWKTFVIVDSSQLGNMPRELDATRETKQTVQRSHTYNLGKMPNETVAISFFLFAHPEGAYDWDWAEYQAWYYGAPVDIIRLNSNYRFITPVAAPVEFETLEIDITPEGGGYVTTTPASQEGISTWYRGMTGTFPNGTDVRVTAHPYAGYQFDHWSDEIAGGVSYQNPAYVKTMTEHRAVKAHFREIEVPPELKVLKYEILGEKAGGSITFAPPALDAEGHYEKGTVVNLTAVVNPGFVFVKWRGEVDNPLSTSLYNTVTMSENRLVKAEFAYAEVEEYWPLEVDIEPAGGGYVTTIPAPVDIDNHFTDGTIGKFIKDTRVKVTAHSNAGYAFWKWSDEIQGGVSYNPTEWVSGVMDEHKAVKAHFREIEVPPECTIDADCPSGYVCEGGVCVPEEEPPPTPPEEKKFPWLPVALLGGGAVLLVASAKPKKK